MTEETEHWYTRSGESAYQVNGRGTTLRDARKLLLVPSVTTVLTVVDKPALTNWKCEQAILAALTMPRGEDTEAEYVKRIMKDGFQQAVDAANEGGKIHDACEQLVKTGDCPDQYRVHAQAAVAELQRLFPDVIDWVAEKSFAHPMGFGGRVDLHSPSTGIVADYKTKPGDFSDGKRLAYDQNIQLAAYHYGLFDRRWIGDTWHACANIFVSRTHPGKVASHLWSADEIASGWRTFECALQLWKQLRKYDGSF